MVVMWAIGALLIYLAIAELSRGLARQKTGLPWGSPVVKGRFN